MRKMSALILVVMLFSGSVWAFTPGSLSRSEIVAQLAHGTGMTAQAVEVALGKNVKALEQATDVLTAVRIINEVAEAKDEKALTTTIDWALDKAGRKLITGPLGGVLTAVTLYKATLELARDRLVIPAVDEKMFQAYRRYREEDIAQKQGDESISSPFDKISSRSDMGYYVLKEKMYQDYLKALGLNPDLIGPSFASVLRAQVDQFWISMLETRFQREYVKAHRDELLHKYWKEAFEMLDQPPTQTRKPVVAQPPRTAPVASPSTPKPASPGEDERLQAAIKKFMAFEEAKAAQHKAYDVKEGKTDTEYKFAWVIPPHREGDNVVFASVMYQKRDAKSDWFGIGYVADAQNPMKIPVSAFISQWGK